MVLNEKVTVTIVYKRVYILNKNWDLQPKASLFSHLNKNGFKSETAPIGKTKMSSCLFFETKIPLSVVKIESSKFVFYGF